MRTDRLPEDGGALPVTPESLQCLELLFDAGLLYRVLAWIVLQDVFGDGLERLRSFPQIDRACLWEFIEFQPLHDLVGLLLHLVLLDFGLYRRAPGIEGVLRDEHVSGRCDTLRCELQQWRPRLVDKDAAFVTVDDRPFDEVWRENTVGVLARREPRVDALEFLLKHLLVFALFRHHKIRQPLFRASIPLSDSFWTFEAQLALIHGFQCVVRKVLLCDKRVLRKRAVGHSERRHLVRKT